MGDSVSKITNEIIAAELKLKKAKENQEDTFKQLAALDVVLNTATIYTSRLKMSKDEAIEVLRNSKFMKDTRDRLMQYEGNQKSDAKVYAERVNRLKGDRYDVARIWINEEINKAETRLAEKKYRQENFIAIDTRRAVLEQVYEFLEGEWPDEEEE